MTDSAPKIHYSPLAEARYADLIEPREQLEAGKPLAWSVDLLLPAADPKTQAIFSKLESLLNEYHGTKKPRSEKGMPLKPDKNNPAQMVMKFKALQLERKGGGFISGPKIIDSKKQPWDDSAIGNGSKLIVAFKTHTWERPEGVGISLIPTAVQVVHFVPYLVDDGVDGFEEQAGGYSVPGFADEFEDEFEEAPF